MDSLDEALIEQPGDEPPKEDAPDDEALHRRIEDEEFRKTPLAPLPQRPIITVPKAPSVPMTEEETAILGVLKKGPVSADDLLYAAREHCPGINWSAQSLNAVLMILEVKKLARRLPDSRYEAAR
jgi:hypothetical protein